MKSSKLLRILIPIFVALCVGYVFGEFLLTFFQKFEIAIRQEIPWSAKLKIFAITVLLSYASIALPFLWGLWDGKAWMHRQNVWKVLGIIEGFGLLIAYGATPPDLTSTLIVLFAWQLPVLSNALILYRITKA